LVESWLKRASKLKTEKNLNAQYQNPAFIQSVLSFLVEEMPFELLTWLNAGARRFNQQIASVDHPGY
jgi:hypothetical protein